MKIKEVSSFNKSDYEAVLKLLPQLSPSAALPTEDSFKSILSSEYTHLFFAELENSQIIGMLTLVKYDLLSGKNFRIEDVIVDDSQRGKGFGKELMLFAIDYAKNHGAKTITLTSRPSRIAANKLYTDLGFVRYETNVYKYDIQE